MSRSTGMSPLSTPLVLQLPTNYPVPTYTNPGLISFYWPPPSRFYHSIAHGNLKSQINLPKMHIFGMWEETEGWKGNPLVTGRTCKIHTGNRRGQG